jgi:translocation and assembly module TamB
MLRRLFRLLVVLSVVAVLAIGALWMLTNTDWGRERVRRYALGAIGGSTHGIVTIGAVHGNLLSGAMLVGVTITDSAGRPFVAVDSMSTHYSIRSFISKRVDLRDVVLYRPRFVVEKLPGKSWNYDILWPQLSRPGTPGDTIPGFGSWIRFDNLSMHNGTVTLRTVWEPRADLSAHARDSLLRVTLADSARIRVIRAPGGYQKVVVLDSIDAILPQLRISDPRFKSRLAVVSALRMVAYPFQPPAARVTALTGSFHFDSDSLWWKDAKAQLPGSKLTASGAYIIGNGDMHLDAVASPASINDLRWVMPTLPTTGSGSARLAIRWKGPLQDYMLRDANIRTGKAHLLGNLGFVLSDTVTFHDADVRFSGVTFTLINDVFPGTGTPRPGELSGSAKFSGTLSRFRIDRSDVIYDTYGRGRNHVVASGVIGFRGKPTIVSASGLHVRLEPLQIDLVTILFPTLPIGGTLSGVATLNGSGDRQLVATGLDIVHQDGPNRSRAIGTASVHTTQPQTLDADVVAQPLALAELNKFAPALGLKGLATGPVHAHGPIDALRMDTRLALPGNGTFALHGPVDFLSTALGYDVVTSVTALDLSRVMVGAPVTSLSGGGTARGRGFKPATMTSELALDFGPSSVDTIGVDSVTLRARVANGLVTVARAQVRGAGAVADVSGQFGLDARHTGTITYAIAVDSLATFARFIPGTASDTGLVQPRPRLTAERLARAKADSARLDRQTEVARAISGLAPRPVQVDTPSAIPRGLLAGSLRANGTIAGNVSHFNLQGTAAGTGLVVKGNAARHLTSSYSWTDARSATPKLVVSLRADTVSAFGFAFDSLAGDLSYLKPGGTIALRVRQGNQRDYGINGDFTLHPAHNELHLANVALRFDSTTWTTPHTSAVRWGTAGIQVVNLELRSGATRRIFANGLLPTKGVANFDLSVTDFAIENVAELLQSDIPVTGRLNLEAHIQGTAESPAMRGALGFVRGTYNGSALPDVHGTFDYSKLRLTTNVTAVDTLGRTLLATVTGTLPVNLALSGVTGSRLIDAPINVALVSDSLPLSLIPQFTDVVTDVGGRAMAHVTVGGTLKKPVLQGDLTLAGAQFKLAATGAFFKDANGKVRLRGDTVFVDSVMAIANGPVRLSGTVGVGNWRTPSMNLTLAATDAELLNNERGKLHADARLRIRGPFDSVTVRGQATVLHGVLYIPKTTGKRLVGPGDPELFSVVDTSITTMRDLFPSQSALLRNLDVNVGLSVDRDTWVRSADANVEVYTDTPLRVSMRGDKLALTGAVDTDRGEYTFLSKRFQITRGSALFIGTPDLNPTVQATAEYHVTQVTGTANIRVIIAGTLLQPRISLESDVQPPLTQSELLSYLAFGESTGSLQQGGPSSLTGVAGGNLVNVASGRLAGIALGELLNEVQGQAARSLGVDVFNITPGAGNPIQSGGAASFITETQLEAGKYISPSTFVSLVIPPGLFTRSERVPPGLTLVHRTNKGYRLETSFTPYYFLEAPTLAGQTAIGSGQFGAFVIREWRF